nr:EAL domain-containing protein [Clostridium frigoris]
MLIDSLFLFVFFLCFDVFHKVIKNEINNNRYYHINKQYQEDVEKNKIILFFEEKIKHLAYHDYLTGLPNRLFLSKQTNHSIFLSNSMKNMIAIMFLDLDDFKMINDTVGHDIGDQLLVEVSKRLINVVEKCDTVARVGGDEFIILIKNVQNMDYINKVAEKILRCFDEFFILNNQNYCVTTSMGVSLYPTDGENAEELIKNADIAMYNAKSEDKNQYVICNPIMKTKINKMMEMYNSLCRALERNEFELYYQPQLSCTSHDIVGLEALIRWNHPELGMVSPIEFIPIAEQTNLIISIGEWVLRTACKQTKSWQNMGLPCIQTGVNLSAKQFLNSNLIKDVEEILKETGLDYQYLELEITESAFMKGKSSIIKTLHILKKLGIHIAIDDFGTEYSSLNYLKQLPVDRIKIPMTFIKGIGSSTKDEAITKAIIILAKNMGLGVITEGVEKKNQLDFLNQEMCDEIQGYYYFKPMPAHEVEELLKKMA